MYSRRSPGTTGAVGGGVRFVYVAGDASGGATSARPFTCMPRRESREDWDTPELVPALLLPLRNTEGGNAESTSIIAKRRLSAFSCEGTLGRRVCWLCEACGAGKGSGAEAFASRKDSAEYSDEEWES